MKYVLAAATVGSLAVGSLALVRNWRGRAVKKSKDDVKMTTKWLGDKDVEKLVDRYDNWLLDCDGVVWLGEEAIKGVPETLAELRRRGKRIFFISNNASKHRSTYMAKFKTLAIEATVEDVITSALGAAQYVVQKYGKGAKVFACGTSGLIQELKDAGATVVEPKYVSDSTTNSSGPSLVPAGELDMDIKAVVAGADWTLTHRKLSYATLCLTCIPNCEFVATNRDRLVPASDGRKYPGAGATVGALENVTSRSSDVTIGKPGPKLLQILFDSQGLDKSRSLMVGDRLDTDIEFGRKGGVDTLLVLTGVSSRQLADSAAGEQVATYGIGSLGDIGAALKLKLVR